eukprot:TRINITY_DN12850_c0_g1_i1.p1 TRINITY_DN12850_c0_g1~~TRINITY_DN12850_c0_g1_i1.p1  ORF type:complete len:475 (-),score=73.71 TRINITY_DN12850_c0_g1_i1:18-1409(-)
MDHEKTRFRTNWVPTVVEPTHAPNRFLPKNGTTPVDSTEPTPTLTQQYHSPSSLDATSFENTLFDATQEIFKTQILPEEPIDQLDPQKTTNSRPIIFVGKSHKINSKSTPLIASFFAEDYEKIDEILTQNPNSVHDRDTICQFPVFNLACQLSLGGIEIMQRMLDLGADMNASCTHGSNPLAGAIVCHKPNAVFLMTKKGVPINNKHPNPVANPLFSAIEAGYFDLAVQLLRMGADPNHTVFNEARPLIHFVLRGNYEAVKLLLQYRADTELKSRDGFPALYFAAQIGNARIVQLLLQYDANINFASENNHSTPLHIAVQRKHEEVVRILLENGAGVLPLKPSNRMFSMRTTPIIISNRQNTPNITLMLLHTKPKKKKEHRKKCVVVMDFIATAPDQLSFKAGDFVFIDDRYESGRDGWLWCQTKERKVLIPMECVKEVEESSGHHSRSVWSALFGLTTKRWK